ncbi:hypothetical protein BJX99DRAFT_263458 [Aspergillus californicus]
MHPENKSNHADFTLTVQYQTDLDIIGVSAAGQVYNIDDHIVLKAASESIFHFGLVEDEKTIFRLLSRHTQSNIIDAIDTSHPEGIYLRKYRPFPQSGLPPQSDRILWYQDILRALIHLHSLDITHADVRKDNILFDAQGHALLGEFGASCPVGFPNPSLPLLLNGPAETVSDATDMLLLPPVQTGHIGLDSLIMNAWRQRYASTAEILAHTQGLSDSEDVRGQARHYLSKEELLSRITR